MFPETPPKWPAWSLSFTRQGYLPHLSSPAALHCGSPGPLISRRRTCRPSGDAVGQEACLGGSGPRPADIREMTQRLSPAAKVLSRRIAEVPPTPTSEVPPTPTSEVRFSASPGFRVGSTAGMAHYNFKKITVVPSAKVGVTEVVPAYLYFPHKSPWRDQACIPGTGGGRTPCIHSPSVPSSTC